MKRKLLTVALVALSMIGVNAQWQAHNDLSQDIVEENHMTVENKTSQAGDSWFVDFDKGLENFNVIKGGDPNSFVITSGGINNSKAMRIIGHRTQAHDDYLVTKAVKASAKCYLSFWARNYRTGTRAEAFDVLLSTKGTVKADFTINLAQNVTPALDWKKYEYDLSAHAGKTVYLAIHCKSTNKSRLYVDNFRYEALTAHDLGVKSVFPDVVITGKSRVPRVVVHNSGVGTEATWSITLTDGKSYNHTLKPGTIESRKSKTVTFPAWSPAAGKQTLTATVTINGDTDPTNNKMVHNVTVLKPSYENGVLYAINNKDSSTPFDMNYHLVKINKTTGQLTSIKQTNLKDVIFCGDFIGSFGDAKILAIDYKTHKVHLINGNGETYFYEQITNIDGNIETFTWDQISDKMYVVTTVGDKSILYSLDANFKGKKVGDIDKEKVGFVSIACDNEGKMYGIGGEDYNFYTIDKSNAKAKKLGPLGIETFAQQEMGFDRGTNKLYATLMESDGFLGGSGGLYTIDVKTGKATLQGKEFKDHLTLVGTYSNIIKAKDLMVEAITPTSFIGHKLAPKVTVRNVGTEAQATWSVKLSDGKGYSKTVTKTGSIAKDATKTITFPEWSPENGTNTLTATVVLAGDQFLANNVRKREINVIAPTYAKDKIYGYNVNDFSKPDNMKNHIITIDKNTAKITSLKSTKLEQLYAGDFVGIAGKSLLMGMTYEDAKVHVFDEKGNVHFYKKITGVPSKMNGFAWDQSSDKVYVATLELKPRLYVLDANFKGTLIGTMSQSLLLNIACDSKGNLYGLGVNDILYKIDKTNAKATAIGNLGIDVKFAQGIGFDRTNDILYGTLYKGNGTGGLYTIDTDTGKATQIKEDFKDEVVLLGIHGNPLPAKDLSVTAIQPGFVRSGSSEKPQVTIINKGLESQTNWSVKLTDGDGYDKTITNKNKLDKGASTILTFPDWSPADGNRTLTATVSLDGDAVTDNNTASQRVNVLKPTYKIGMMYGFNLRDNSDPKNMSKHIVNVDMKTATLTSLKASGLDVVLAGDFVGTNDKALLMAVSFSDKKIYVVNGNGDTYHYKTISGITKSISGFTWDMSSNKIYVSTTGENAELYVLDENFKGTLVGTISKTPILSIACDANGDLYGLGLSIRNPKTPSKLYKINKVNGKGTVVGSHLGIYAAYAQDMSFDRGSGTLYGTLFKGRATGGLYTIDTKTGKAKQIEKDFKDQVILLGVFSKVDPPVTSIDESLAEQGIAIYPNPSNGIFNVETKESFTMKIVDVNGRTVAESKEINGIERIEIQHSGIYFINFTNDKTSLTQRIIVSK